MQDWGGCTALVVEDSPVQRDHMTGLLRQAGFGAVLQACDGIDALRVLDARGAPVQLVLTDLDMPGMDGVELIRHLRELELASALVVASARETRLREAQQSIDQGCTRIALLGAALKPLHFDVLNALLAHADVQALLAAAADAAPDAEELAAALERQEFLPYYEPRIEIASGLLHGVEVQASWLHPQRGLIRGARVLSALQDGACVGPLALSIATQAVQQLRAWYDIGLVTLSMSVRLPAQLLADRRLVDALAALAQQHGVAARHITWSIPESLLSLGAPLTIANLAHLSVRGFGLGLHGYRAGQTTQQQLVRCPLTELHIDHVIVHEASQQPARQALLQQAVAEARELGLAVVGEGVELPADLALLRAMGCALAQGALVAAPMPAQAMLGWIKGNRRRLKDLAQPERGG